MKINTSMFRPDMFYASCQLQALSNLLQEAGIFTQQEADIALKKVILSEMREAREFLAERRREALARAIMPTIDKLH